jgi:hypothetical protein
MISKLEDLKRLLWEKWDPIGVNDMPDAVDEYDSYAFAVWMALHRGARTKDIEFYLTEIQAKHMGSPRTARLNRAVAAEAVRLFGADSSIV